MNKTKVAQNIDFADSEYKSFHMSEDATLTIHMNNWQEIPIKLIFSHTVKFLYSLGDVPKGLFEIQENSTILNEVILKKYGDLSRENLCKYKLYQLEDIDDFPFIQIIAKSAIVIKCTENT
jgi:hypothetical protein